MHTCIHECHLCAAVSVCTLDVVSSVSVSRLYIRVRSRTHSRTRRQSKGRDGAAPRAAVDDVVACAEHGHRPDDRVIGPGVSVCVCVCVVSCVRVPSAACHPTVTTAAIAAIHLLSL